MLPNLSHRTAHSVR